SATSTHHQPGTPRHPPQTPPPRNSPSHNATNKPRLGPGPQTPRRHRPHRQSKPQRHQQTAFGAGAPNATRTEQLAMYVQKPLILPDTKKTRGLCRADTLLVEDWAVMLAQKLSNSDSELPTRPLNARPS